MAKRENKGLSDVELLIMRGVWFAVEHYGSVRTSELVTILNKEFECSYAYSSIITYIERMENKGYLQRQTVANVAQLIPLVSKEEYARKLILEEKNLFFDNDKMAQLEAVMKVNGITIEELAVHMKAKNEDIG